MSDTSIQDFYTQQAAEARGPEPDRPPGRKGKRRRLKRIAIAAGLSLVVAVGAVAGVGYVYANSLLSRVHRIHGIVALTAAHQPWEAQGSMNVLLTDSQVVPHQDTETGLIELMHLNANGRGGAVVSFPANIEVRVPGHGRVELGDTLRLGGPSLMIETIERLTNVRIDHYSVIDFGGLAQVVGAIGGVNVTVPYAFDSFGFHFNKGVDRITDVNALAYVRQVAISEVGRMELQENLFRAILRKIANNHLLLPHERGRHDRQRGQRGQQPQQLPAGEPGPAAGLLAGRFRGVHRRAHQRHAGTGRDQAGVPEDPGQPRAVAGDQQRHGRAVRAASPGRGDPERAHLVPAGITAAGAARTGPPPRRPVSRTSVRPSRGRAGSGAGGA